MSTTTGTANNNLNSMTSTGRGGAGNIGDSSKSPKIQPADLTTPTLKTAVYTTGRGGSGNMVANDDAEAARAAQDVGPIERVPSNSGGVTHVGRGGAANVAKKTDADGVVEAPVPGDDQQQQQHKGLAAKAKDFFTKKA